MISETILKNNYYYPEQQQFNFTKLLKLNSKKYKNLLLHDKYILLEELKRRFNIIDNVSPKDRKDLKGEPTN